MRILVTLSFLAVSSLLYAQSNAEKAITKTLDDLKTSVDNKDFEAFKSLYTDDVLIYGTDPGEAPFETAVAMQQMKNVFASDQINYTYELLDRDIHVMQGGKTAIAVEQGKTDMLGKNIQFRNVYHLTKSSGKWLINFYSVAMIPKNQDLQKVDAAAGQ